MIVTTNPQELKALSQSFWDKVANPKTEQALLCLVLGEISSITDSEAVEVKLQKLERMRAWVTMMDLKRLYYDSAEIIEDDDEKLELMLQNDLSEEYPRKKH